MKYRRLGKTDMKVSVIGIGTWQFGGEWGKNFTGREAEGIIKAGKEEGINLIDTAECYGDHLSESLVGEAIKDDREDWIVATKFGHKYLDRFTRDHLWSAEDVQKQLEDSLKALKTDYVDLYQFHSGDNPVFDNDDLWLMLERMVKQGKIRHLGISLRFSDYIHQTDKATEVGAETIQVVYNRLKRDPEKEVLPSCIRQDLGVLARVPLASGFLSGKYSPGARFPKTDVRSRRSFDKIDDTLKEVEKIKRDEVPEGVNMAQWAMAWCLKHEAVTCCIPGCKNIEQTVSNAKAADLDMVSKEHPQAWKE